jgi:ribosomal protein S6--L-glutamate ligase
MLRLARRVGQYFGLDLYGVDVLETPQGLVIVDINDFPSFYGVPRKVSSVAEYILHAAYRARQSRNRSTSYPLTTSRKLLHRQDHKSIKPAELAPQSIYMQRALRP